MEPFTCKDPKKKLTGTDDRLWGELLKGTSRHNSSLCAQAVYTYFCSVRFKWSIMYVYICMSLYVLYNVLCIFVYLYICVHLYSAVSGLHPTTGGWVLGCQVKSCLSIPPLSPFLLSQTRKLHTTEHFSSI